MNRIAFALSLSGLLGCSLPADVATTSVGEVEFAGQSYPIEALGRNPAIWRVKVDGWPVTCRKPTAEDCYWSLRNYLNAQELLGDLGS